MKININLPSDDESITELNNRVATFHATLLLHTIQNLQTDNKSKKNILDSVIHKLSD